MFFHLVTCQQLARKAGRYAWGLVLVAAALAGPRTPVDAAPGPGPGAPCLSRLAQADTLMAEREFSRAAAAYGALLGCGSGPAEPDSLYARVRCSYGYALLRCGRIDEAGRNLDLGLEAWSAVAGSTSSAFGEALERHARWLASQWRVEEAQTEFTRAFDILTRARGDRHPETLKAEHGVAFCLENLGDQEAAAVHYRHVLAVREEILPPDDLTLAWTRHDYAVALHGLGRLREAEELYRKSCEVRRRRDPEHFCPTAWGYAACLTSEGAYRQALRVLDEVHEVMRERPELRKSMAVGTLAREAYVSLRTGDLTAADRLLTECAQLADSLDVDERTALQILQTRAAVLEGWDHREAAIRVLEDYIARFRKQIGEHSSLIAGHLGHLARLYDREGSPAVADSLYRAALEGYDLAGEPTLFGTLASDYALFLLARKDPAAAAAWSRRALRATSPLPPLHCVRTKALETDARVEQALGDADAAWKEAEEAASSSLSRYRLNLQALPGEQILAYRLQEHTSLDVLLALLARRPSPDAGRVERAWTLVASSRGALIDELRRRRRLAPEPDSLQVLKRRLSHLLAADPGRWGERPVLPHLAETQARVADLEARYAVRQPARKTLPVFELRSLARALPLRAAVVAYVLYQADGAGHYGAFSLTPPGPPRFVPLGPADRIDALVDSLATLMASAPREVLLDPDGAEHQYREVAGRLRKRILDPVFGERPPADLTVVPTGSLWQVNFLTLPAGDGTYLADSLAAFRLELSEQELGSASRTPAGTGLLAVGGIRYGDASTATPALAALPRSEEEIRMIARTWREKGTGSAGILLGDEATEAAVCARARGKRVLHLATHGLFESGSGMPSPVTGLFVSGSTAGGARGDGIWTDFEIALEDLSGVELVFLSSCRSAGEETAPGEGLSGLYEAFRVAGARSVIMSLGDIGDRPSRDWCSTFYRHFLGADSDPALATLRTSSEILARSRLTGRPTHPFYWGGFIAVGGSP